MSKQFNNIDKEIRRKFEGFEESPPDNLWSNIKSSMQTTPKVAPSKPVRVGPLSMNAAIISVSVIIVATIIAIINPFNNIQTSEPVAQIVVDTTTNENIKTKEESVIVESQRKKETLENEIKQIVVIPENIESGEPPIVEENEKKIEENKSGLSLVTIGEDKTQITGKKDENEETVSDKPDKTETEPEKNLNDTDTPDNPKEDKSETTTNDQEPSINSAPPPPPDYGQRDKWSAGIYFTPEYTYYSFNNNYSKNGYALELLTTRHWKDVIIQFGIGVTSVNDNGSFSINYDKLNVVGGYEHVDSLSFNPSGTEVTYYTTYVTIKDTVSKVSNNQTANNYTYIQFPVMFGYEVLEHKRFNCYLKAGPALAVLIDKKEQNNTFADLNATITNISDNTPVRINTNWQLWGSLNINYMVNDRIYLSAEPIIKYYITSAYERKYKTTKNTYSLGLRVGFRISL